MFKDILSNYFEGILLGDILVIFFFKIVMIGKGIKGVD